LSECVITNIIIIVYYYYFHNNNREHNKVSLKSLKEFAYFLKLSLSTFIQFHTVTMTRPSSIWHVTSFVNRDNFMVLICAIYDFTLITTDVDSSKNKSLAVDSLLAAAAPNSLATQVD